MIKLGEIQDLQIKRFTSVGAYLNVENPIDERDVLLPQSQIPKGVEEGDIIEVFIYKDSDDRMIATVRKPKITLGNLAHLRVVDTTKIGIFLDWGLERDLFMPFAETVGSVEKGEEYLVGMYIDKSNRLCATMKVKDMLSTDSNFKENDTASGTIYSIHDEYGAFVAVEDKYDGLIPKRELLGVHKVGEKLQVRINRVLDDGKLDLSLRDRSYIQMDEDAAVILNRLNEKGGKLMLNDDSPPELIREELHMSKSGFKRAVGMLLKEKRIKFIKNGIQLID